ncbi:signal peptidase I [Rhizobium leguminosarum]|uniref:Signal peptidase I n=1 Tax=Rhizobium leguminosarum TaxID=384 RepID=A0AAE2MHE4_RHILE|nr:MULTISPECIES: signal peptidase I [Rhizobium]MBB4289219.1 signal peptidase I [Rhizobium leguminosarum]MBB4294686.1 signal peptidase I [Rhizobium leguminosarum]MBB4306081.1 signal peptidase I [Rhizobium leguminosarum]MBB4418341.1 signal peptidase I [Rhizobium leguminosarum]MBB4433186.1 signal peptidase I [Rhizobium esperanzae]
MSEKVEAKPNALWENIKVIIQALILAMVIRTVLFQPFTIPSGSMMPTLLVGDYIFVNKFAYGYSKYSLPFSPDIFSGRLFGADPKRGDIVVFRFPPNPEVDYIKRCIGLPGDHIQVTDGVLYVNGKPVPKVADGTFTSDYKLDPGADVPVFRETLDNGKTYDTLDQSPVSRGDNTREFIVPEGHYFMMGDNRDNSLDSRFDVGFVPAENLVGRASVIFFSLGNDTSFREIWKWPTNMRWDRLFKVVE